MTTFEELRSIPTFKSALLYKDEFNTDHASIRSDYKDFELLKARTLVTDVDLPTGRSNSFELPDTIKVVAYNNFAPFNGFVYLKEVDSKRFVEVWNNGRILYSLDVTEHHGPFYNDETFASIDINSTGEKICYIAEYRDKTLESCKTQDKFEYRADWGERLVGKRYPTIVVVDLVKKAVVVREDLRKHDTALGQVSFGPGDQLLYTNFSQIPRPYGLIYCTNRPSCVFLEDENISADYGHSRYPIYDSDTSAILFLSNAIGGAHVHSSALCRYDIRSRVVDVLCEEIFAYRLMANSIFKSHLIVQLLHEGNSTVSTIDLRSKSRKFIEKDSKPYSLSLLGVKNGTALIHYRSLCTAGQVYRITFGDDESNQLLNENLIYSHSPEIHALSNIQIDNIQLKELPCANAYYARLPCQPGEKRPLVAIPHGGPHSSHTLDFSALYAMLIQSGISVLLINYRGTPGWTEQGIQSLIGKIGSQDVDDVKAIVDYCLKTYEIDSEKLYIFGGSHGGFLAAWLIGRWPDLFKGCLLRNPVINVGTNLVASDIPDWSYAESGIEYDLLNPITVLQPALYEKMFQKSPISVVHQVKTTVRIMLGQDDRRVPNYEGLSYHHALPKGLSKCYTFPNNGHPLDGVEAERMLWLILSELLCL